MPLQVSTESPEVIAKSLESAGSKPVYIVIYASETDGRMWCSDCRDAKPLIDEKFGSWGDVVKIVHAGQKAEYVTGWLFLSTFSRHHVWAMGNRS